jgi:hypothetical protein
MDTNRLKAVLAIAALILIVYLFGIEVGQFYERERMLRHDFDRLMGAIHGIGHQEKPSGLAAQEARCPDGNENSRGEVSEGEEKQ